MTTPPSGPVGWACPACGVTGAERNAALAGRDDVRRRITGHRYRRVEQACEVMHDAYERSAVGAGWETQQASRKPWADVPEANKATMRVAVGALLAWMDVTVERAT